MSRKTVMGTRALVRPLLLALVLAGCSTGPSTEGRRVDLPAWYEDPSYPG